MLYGPHVNAVERMRSGGPWSAKFHSGTGVGTMRREEGWAERALLLPPAGAPPGCSACTQLIHQGTKKAPSCATANLPFFWSVKFVVKDFLTVDPPEVGATGEVMWGLNTPGCRGCRWWEELSVRSLSLSLPAVSMLPTFVSVPPGCTLGS